MAIKNIGDAQKKSRWLVNQSTLQKENHKNIPRPLRYSALVRITGVEPAWNCFHMDLNHTRLPIPPYPHVRFSLLSSSELLRNLKGRLSPQQRSSQQKESAFVKRIHTASVFLNLTNLLYTILAVEFKAWFFTGIANFAYITAILTIVKSSWGSYL